MCVLVLPSPNTRHDMSHLTHGCEQHNTTQVALSRLFISGRAERVWLLGMAYSPDNDQYEIDSIQQLHPECAPSLVCVCLTRHRC